MAPSLPALLLASVAGLLLPFASATPVPSAAGLSPPSYWEVSYTSGSPPSGARWENVNATYSGAPQTVITCTQTYDPATRKTKQTCSDKTFSYSVGVLLGRNAIVVQQTVQPAGAAGPTFLYGTNTIALTCTTGAEGKTCTGATQVPAIVELDNGDDW